MNISPLLKKLTFVFIALLLLYSLSRNLFEYSGKMEYLRQNQNEVKTLKDDNKELKTRLKQSEDYYVVEREIRENLNLTKPGEVAVILPAITPTMTPTPTVYKSTPKQWIEVFWSNK